MRHPYVELVRLKRRQREAWLTYCSDPTPDNAWAYDAASNESYTLQDECRGGDDRKRPNRAWD